MADSEDEFDDGLDDEAMLLAAADTADAPAGLDALEGRPSKRPRLNEFDQPPVRTIGGLSKHGRYTDARGSSVNQPFEIGSQPESAEGAWNGEWRLRGPQSNLRQTTLFGALSSTTSDSPSSQHPELRHNWPLAGRAEQPTHHSLDQDALRTWVYPINIGTIREYQYNIVARGLYHNILVALPTGLGKTFIAATIMLNWYRWTKDSQIVFVAPTKPLVSQQVDACFKIAGIPRSQTTMLTGGISPGIRAEEWNEKRVFFMTPQTIINDLKAGICDPKRIVLLVVDEAHRATGAYAYVEVVKFLRRFNPSFRVLALTATPGSSVEGVQEVIDGLGISRVEIRHEDSLDIRQYVHHRNIETTVFEYSEELLMCMTEFSKALQPLLNKLKGQNAYWSNNPMTLTAYGCVQAQQKWQKSDAGRNASAAIKGMINNLFPTLAGLAHAIDLLKFHGIGPFYHKLVASDSPSSKKKSQRQVFDSEPFRTMMARVKAWISDRDFVGHPKLEALRSIALNHFMDAGEGRQEGGEQISPARTRIMVFAHFRDSAEEIVRVLKRNEPMVRPHVFVGQANSKGSEGMDQKTQLDVIEKFRKGVYNILVATSIGEEGLDIGEVDLIVCYDGHASPIRMLQRMGRTGRKRAGQIEVLLMKDKEYDNFQKAKDNYEKMQEMIASGKRFTFHDELSARIVPRDVQPIVEKKVVEIPIENTQADLPEPKRRGRAPKKPPKKFHYPDNARLGFTTAFNLARGDEEEPIAVRSKKPPTPEPIPALSDVLLTDAQTQELERVYQSISGEEGQMVEHPSLDAHPSAQRELRPTARILHGQKSQSLTKMLCAMHKFTDPFASVEHFEENLHAEDRSLIDGRGTSTPDSSTRNQEQEHHTQAGMTGETLGSESEGLEEDDDPRDASDLADFINDDESDVHAHSIDSASSPVVLAILDSPKHSTSATYDVPLTQLSASTAAADLDSLLKPEMSSSDDQTEAIPRRRRKAVVDSDGD